MRLLTWTTGDKCARDAAGRSEITSGQSRHPGARRLPRENTTQGVPKSILRGRARSGSEPLPLRANPTYYITETPSARFRCGLAAITGYRSRPFSRRARAVGRTLRGGAEQDESLPLRIRAEIVRRRVGDIRRYLRLHRGCEAGLASPGMRDGSEQHRRGRDEHGRGAVH